MKARTTGAVFMKIANEHRLRRATELRVGSIREKKRAGQLHEQAIRMWPARAWERGISSGAAHLLLVSVCSHAGQTEPVVAPGQATCLG